MVEKVTVPKKEWLEMKATIKKLQSKVTEVTKSSSAEGFKIGGGFFDILEEGAQIYDLRKESIKSSGLLLDALAGPAGFVSKFAQLAESDVSIFGSIKPTIQAFEDLGKATTSFAMTSEEMQTKLGTTLAVFKELGVDVQDFSAVLDSARLGFGMAAVDAEKLARSVGNIGLATGVGMGKAMKNFSTAQSSMAYDSKKLMENFKQLQFTAATTGVSFDKLTSAFGDSMDTFEGSAGKAGSLNAILGRSIFNSIDLLGKTEGERVSTIVEGIRKSVDVNALSKNKFQLKAVAEGLGLSVDDTRKLLTGQTSVDAVLAGKTPKDHREKAISKMTELLRDGTNPEIEKFVDALKKGRTELVNTGAELNAKQREFFRKIIQTATAGFTDDASSAITANTPAELFTYLEGAVQSIRKNLSVEKFTELQTDMRRGAADLLSARTREQQEAAVKAIFDRLSIARRNDQAAGQVRYTHSSQARTAKGEKTFTQEAIAKASEKGSELMAGLVDKMNVVLSGAVKFVVGEHEFDAYIVDKVKSMPAGKK